MKACKVLAILLLAGTALPALAAEDSAMPATTEPQSGNAPAPEAAPADTPEGRQSYPASAFERFAPRNALDMLRNVPGFQIRADDNGSRGLGQASDNVIVNGQRLSSKSDSLYDQLQRIPADTVVRIDIVDGASLSIPGLSGQVADVITRPDAFSGQFEWNPEFRPHFSHPGYTGASVSVKGALTDKLEYTAALANDSNRGSFGGPYPILDGTGAIIERRDGRLWSDYDAPKLSGSLKWDAPGTMEANINALYRKRYSTYNENEDRMPVAGGGYNRDLYGRGRGYNYEIGGDLAFDVFGARLKLIGLNRFQHRTYDDRLIDRPFDGGDRSGGRFSIASDSGEVIGRAELGWKWGKADWQIATEAAFNRLDNDAGLFDLDPITGEFVEMPFPGGDGGVREKRYETIASYGRPLSSKLTLQLSAGAEQSTIFQTGPGGLSRDFFRPKGSANLAWTPMKGLDISLKVERVVGQLDFGDFLASIDLNQGNQNDSNAKLVPSQTWNVDLESKRDLGALGTTNLRLFYRRTEDYVALVPLPGGGEGTGNIPQVDRYGLEWNTTFKLDTLGLKGARIDTGVFLQHSRLKDPLTGEIRQLDYLTSGYTNVDFRWDIPGSDWAFGLHYEISKQLPYYRLGEIGRNYEGPVFDAFSIEHKDVFGLTVSAEAINLFNGRHRLYRTVYDGQRPSAPILFIEDRDQLIGPIFRFSVKGSF